MRRTKQIKARFLLWLIPAIALGGLCTAGFVRGFTHDDHWPSRSVLLQGESGHWTIATRKELRARADQEGFTIGGDNGQLKEAMDNFNDQLDLTPVHGANSARDNDFLVLLQAERIRERGKCNMISRENYARYCEIKGPITINHRRIQP